MKESISLTQAKANLDRALAELAEANARYAHSVSMLARGMKDFLAGGDDPSAEAIKAFLSRVPERA